ncbi:hypothetical protein AOXY_G32046, partial [Acipenser oxyrinchus oxyrinchus]
IIIIIIAITIISSNDTIIVVIVVIIFPGFDRYSSLGETVTLPCAGFQKYENSFIYWTFSQRSETASELASGGKITVKQPERAARLEVLPDSSLRIHHLHTEDAGQYECQQYVNGNYHTGGTPVVLNLLTSKCGLDRYASLGETVTLPCAGFQEYENSFIYWIFSQRSETFFELALDGKITVKQPERAARLEVLPDSSLRIHHLHTEDAGQYECQQYVNGRLYKGGTPVVLTLLTSKFTADPGRDLKRGTALALQCTLVCNGGIADCSSAPDNVKLTWVDDEGTALQGDRFKITPYRTHSTLSLELQKSDHNRRWRCNLTEEGEVKASYSYTTTLTGIIHIIALY